MAAIAVAAGLINIKKISSTTFDGGAGASAGGGGSATASIPTMSPQTSMYSSGNNQANNLSSTNNGMEQPTIKAVVVESDITASQNKMNKIKESATL
jgi:hypothetical protein